MKHVRDFHAQSWDNPFFEHTGPHLRFATLRLFSGFAATVLLVYVFVYSPLLRLGKVTVSGAVTVDPLTVQMTTVQLVSGYAYLVIPKNHYFYVNPIGLKNFLVAHYPNLLDVKVKKHFGKLEVDVVERQPTYRLIAGDRSFLLDQEGKGLRVAAAGEGDALIALSEESAVFDAGKSVIRREWLEAINDLHKYFATQTNVRDQLYKLDPVNDRIEVVTVEGWSAIFDPQSDISDQLKSLTSALAGKFNPSSRKKLLYIDARFGDKVFYQTNQ